MVCHIGVNKRNCNHCVIEWCGFSGLVFIGNNMAPGGLLPLGVDGIPRDSPEYIFLLEEAP